MKIDKTVEGCRMNVKVFGKLDAISASQFEKNVSENLEGITELILDFGGVEYVSSAGLRALLVLQLDLSEKDAAMTIMNVPEQVKEIFEVTGFYNAVTIV